MALCWKVFVVVFSAETGEPMLHRYDAVDCSSCGYRCFSLLVVVPQFTYLIVDLKRNPCLCFVLVIHVYYLYFFDQSTWFDFCTFFCSDIASLAGLLNGNVRCILDGVVVGCWVWFFSLVVWMHCQHL